MVEQIEKIRLMMAEQRYIEAQQLVEQTMLMHKSDQLLGLYIEIHQLQDSLLPYSETVAFVKTIQEQDPHRSLDLLFKLKAQTIEVKLLEMNLYARLGALDELYKSISNFYLYLYERKIPRIFVEVQNLRRKFFTKDFKLELQEIAVEADRGWTNDLENRINHVIQECFQSYNVKNRLEKIQQIHQVVEAFPFTNSSRIIAALLKLYLEGVKGPKDYKKLIELVLYFEEISMKAIVLNLLDKLELQSAAASYADSFKLNADYNFVLFEKYYPHLKKYFVTAKKESVQDFLQTTEIDLTLSKDIEDNDEEDVIHDMDETNSDSDILENLKHLEYDLTGWLNLSVGFLQSDFPKSAHFCAQRVRQMAMTDEDFLKGSYLATHALMKSQDYRLALDYCYEAIERSTLETDMLSFSYLEAELLIQLGEKKAAKIVISEIQKIDADFRLSSKMQKRLDEI